MSVQKKLKKDIMKNFNEEIENIIKKIFEKNLTVVDVERARSLADLCIDVIQNKVDGDFVETGVYKGGMIVLMAAINKITEANKKIFACDSFKGSPSVRDLKYNIGENSREGEFCGTLDEVKQNLNDFGLLDDNVIFVEGWFKDTLHQKDSEIKKISILRLDGDYYSSTLEVLESLYDKVSDSGYIIIDDYALNGCRNAVNIFLSSKKLNPEIQTPYGDWDILSDWAKKQNPSEGPEQNIIKSPAGAYWKKTKHET